MFLLNAPYTYFNLRQDDIIGILVILVIFVILIPFFKNMGVFLDTRSGEASQLPGGAFFFLGGGDFFRKKTRIFMFFRKNGSKKTAII